MEICTPVCYDNKNGVWMVFPISEILKGGEK